MLTQSAMYQGGAPLRNRPWEPARAELGPRSNLGGRLVPLR